MRTLLELLRSQWFRGTVDCFDRLVSKTVLVDVVTASKLRDRWIDLGFLAYDERGMLVWCVMPQGVMV